MSPYNLFDRCYMISLNRSSERRKRFWEGFKSIHWPFAEPTEIRAIDSVHKVPIPDQFRQDDLGAYGCLRSHQRILEDALNLGLTSIFILEDDAIFSDDFDNALVGFLSELPTDWQGIMLGGQHVLPATPIFAHVVKVNRACRTHAYGLRGEWLAQVYKSISMYTDHLDKEISRHQKDFNVYAPAKWIIGQSGDKSETTGLETTEQFFE